VGLKEDLKKFAKQVELTPGWRVEWTKRGSLDMVGFYPPATPEDPSPVPTWSAASPKNSQSLIKTIRDVRAAGWDESLSALKAKPVAAPVVPFMAAAAPSQKVPASPVPVVPVPLEDVEPEEPEEVAEPVSGVVVDLPPWARRMNGDAKPRWVVVERVWTPDLAAEALLFTTYQGCNTRPLSADWKKRFAREMNEGNWAVTPQGVAIDQHGCVLDAKHRLEAIVETGIAQTMLTFLQVPNDLFKYLDSGHNRTIGHLLAIDGRTDDSRPMLSGKHFGEAILLIERYRSGAKVQAWAKLRLDDRQKLELANTTYADVDLEMMKYFSGDLYNDPGISVSAAVAFRYLSNDAYPDGPIGAFGTILRTGADEDGLLADDDNPAMALRKTITNAARVRRKVSNVEYLALMLKAWGLFCDGETKSRMAWRMPDGDGKGGEDIPVVYQNTGESFAVQNKKFWGARDRAWDQQAKQEAAVRAAAAKRLPAGRPADLTEAELDRAHELFVDENMSLGDIARQLSAEFERHIPESLLSRAVQ